MCIPLNAPHIQFNFACRLEQFGKKLIQLSLSFWIPIIWYFFIKIWCGFFHSKIKSVTFGFCRVCLVKIYFGDKKEVYFFNQREKETVNVPRFVWIREKITYQNDKANHGIIVGRKPSVYNIRSLGLHFGYQNDVDERIYGYHAYENWGKDTFYKLVDLFHHHFIAYLI